MKYPRQLSYKEKKKAYLAPVLEVPVWEQAAPLLWASSEGAKQHGRNHVSEQIAHLMSQEVRRNKETGVPQSLSRAHSQWPKLPLGSSSWSSTLPPNSATLGTKP
jgi:hypothetical protein